MEFVYENVLGDKKIEYNVLTYNNYMLLNKKQRKSLNEKCNRLFLSVSTCKTMERCPNDFIVFAYIDKKIVGFIHIVPTDFYYSNNKLRFNTDVMHVDHIVVHPKYHNMKIGSTLYNNAFSILNKLPTKEVNALFCNNYSEMAFNKVTDKLKMKRVEDKFSGEISAKFKKNKYKQIEIEK